MGEGWNMFHKAIQNEGCSQVADDSNTSLSNFLAWSLDLGSDYRT